DPLRPHGAAAGAARDGRSPLLRGLHGAGDRDRDGGAGGNGQVAAAPGDRGVAPVPTDGGDEMSDGVEDRIRLGLRLLAEDVQPPAQTWTPFRPPRRLVAIAAA